MAPLGEVDRVRVTTVVDNYIDALRQDEKVARRHSAFVARQMPDLRAEHGLAHYVEVTRGAETVRIAFLVGELVVDAMRRDPENRSALERQRAADREEVCNLDLGG